MKTNSKETELFTDIKSKLMQLDYAGIPVEFKRWRIIPAISLKHPTHCLLSNA